MQFWVGWALWQKLSAVLALLLVIVLIYSFSILLHNRRMVKKHAAAEAYQRAEQGTELHTITTGGSDIPFGARALEKGVQVDGIWISNSNTSSPLQLATPIASRSVTPVVSQSPKPLTANDTVDVPTQSLLEQSVSNTTGHDSRRTSRFWNTDFAGSGRPSSILSNNFRGSQLFPPGILSLHPSRDIAEPDRRRSRGLFGPRSSWITKSPEKDKQKPVVEGHHRRQSSEDFRRRISRLIEESLQTRSREDFRLNPIPLQDVNNHK